MSEQPIDEIVFRPAGSTTTRGSDGYKSINVEILKTNVNIFLNQIQIILNQTPEDIGPFKLTEFTVTAEVSAKGVLSLMGTGIETEGKGGLTFKFERK